MAKQKKKSKAKTSFIGSLESTKEVKASLKRFNWRRAFYIMVSTIIAFAVFEAIISFEASRGMTFSVITIVYYAIVTILLCTIIFLNRGLSNKELTPDMFPEEEDKEHVRQVCDKINNQKKLAKKLMLVLIPFIFTLFLDIIYLFYGDILNRFLSLFAPSTL